MERPPRNTGSRRWRAGEGRKPAPALFAMVPNLVLPAGERLEVGPEDTTGFSTLLRRTVDAVAADSTFGMPAPMLSQLGRKPGIKDTA